MAPLRAEGVAAGRETVNKECRESKLCPRQHSVPVSASIVPLSLLPLRGLKSGRGEFQESKLERQHEFGRTEK